MWFPSLEDLSAAHQRIQPFIHRTAVMSSRLIDEEAGASLIFKCENFQKMGAFKMRGATNAILSLSEEQRKKGVATHSSGNHGQALALAARSLGVKAYVVMPENAPAVKRAAVEAYGAKVIPVGPSLKDRVQGLEKVVKQTGATFIHASNDAGVIIGQSTAAMEFMEENPGLDAIFTPVGGGGLLAGTALAIHHFSPETQLFAGEPAGAADAFRSLREGSIQPSLHPQTIADGLRTELGDLNFPIIQKLVKEIILVEEAEIIAAMRLIWERMKIVIEPSSAVPLAAILKRKQQFAGKKIGVILSGGNVDVKQLPF